MVRRPTRTSSNFSRICWRRLGQPLTQPDRFDAFAKSVLGAGYMAAKAAQLKEAFGKWVAQFGEFMDRSLPAASPWGPARLDAFGMIFNRVTGRDLGLPGNIKTADAPVSYPFLWNASRQDRTQWNGGVPNGLHPGAWTQHRRGPWSVRRFPAPSDY